MGDLYWLSNDELFYLKDGYDDGTVWNVKTNAVYPFYAKDETIPSEIGKRDFYNTDFSSLSPDHTIQAGFYDLPTYRGFFNDNTAEGIATLVPLEPHISGFDLYFLKEGTNRHIDLKGQFVQSIVWSPSR